MGNKCLLSVLSLVMFLLVGCVSDPQLQDQNTLLNTELKHVRVELHEAQEKIKRLDAQLVQLAQAQKDCSEKLADLKAKNTYLENINLQLSQNVERLNHDLKKKKSVIKLQDKVIRLLDDTKKTIATSLKDEIATQDIEIVEMEDTFKVVFIDKILFDSGSAEINDKGKQLLLVVAESIRAHKDESIMVEGHTDNLPLGPTLKEKFPSNWELSVARAAAVVRFLQKEGRLQPERLAAHGYSFYRPVASNKNREGRRQNRRIEIILGPSSK
ncbi:MAG: flagellar motor protein MotB [Desulfobacterales bacterium]|nr:flagellar motor protein MotB [Desulfobacterales bacterium]